MKLYVIHGYTSYGLGMAVVAANNPKQAAQALREYGHAWGDEYFGLEQNKPINIRGARVEGKKPHVVAQSSYIE